MTQSASSPYPVRPIDENELDGFLRVDEHAFNTSPWSADDRRVALDLFEFDRTLAAFDDTTPVGVTMCYTFQLSVPGLQMLPAAGVTFVAVMPTYRRQGVLSSLMRRQLADVRDRGEPLAILWASEAVIYGRYGYGRASWHLDFTLRRGEGGLADPGVSAGTDSAADRRARGRPARAGQGLRRGAGEPGPGCSAATTRGGGARSSTRPSIGTAPARCAACSPRTTAGRAATPCTAFRPNGQTVLPARVLNIRELVAYDPEAPLRSGLTCSPRPGRRGPRPFTTGRRSAAAAARRPARTRASSWTALDPADRRPAALTQRRTRARWTS